MLLALETMEGKLEYEWLWLPASLGLGKRWGTRIVRSGLLEVFWGCQDTLLPTPGHATTIRGLASRVRGRLVDSREDRLVRAGR